MDGVEGLANDSLLVTFVERKTRFQVALKAKSKRALDILKVVIQFKGQFGIYVKSITCDNGKEFVNGVVSKYILQYLGDLYIANSYAPYERGTNEALIVISVPNGIFLKVRGLVILVNSM